MTKQQIIKEYTDLIDRTKFDGGNPPNIVVVPDCKFEQENALFRNGKYPKNIALVIPRTLKGLPDA